MGLVYSSLWILAEKKNEMWKRIVNSLYFIVYEPCNSNTKVTFS